MPISKSTYKTPDKAATAALDAIYGKSNSQHIEYGGRIVRLADGTYAYTSPVTQNHAATVDVDDGAKEGTRIPGGSANIGDYHTHPSIPGYAGEQFSGQDAAGNVRMHELGYIEGPSRSIYKLDGRTVQSYFDAPQSVLRSGPPQ